MNKPNIIIFGGSFNPYHNGHDAIINYLKSNYTDQIMIVPTINPQKEQIYLTLEQRINFLEEYFKNDKRIDISNACLKNPDNNYVCNLFESYKDCQIKYVLGTDALASISTWKNYDLWKNNIELIVFKRYKHEENGIYLNDLDYENDISSTNIRINESSSIYQNDKIIQIYKNIIK